MKIYRFLFRYVSRLKGKLVWKTILNLMCGGISIFQALAMARMVDLVWKKADWQELLPEILTLTGLLILRGVLIRQTEIYGKTFGIQLKSSFRMMILDKIYQLGPGYMNAKRSGQMTSLILDGTELLEPFFTCYIPQIFTVLITGIFSFWYLWQYDQLGSIILICSMVLCVLVPMISVPMLRSVGSDYWSQYSVLTAQYIDTVQGIMTLKTLNAEKSRGKVLHRDAEKFYRQSVRNTGISLLDSALMIILCAMTSSVSVAVVAFRVWEGKAVPEAVTVFLFLAVECARPMMELNRYWHASFQGLSAAGELCDFMNQSPEVKDTGDQLIKQEQLSHTLSMDQVSFSYTDGNEVLKNLSFTVQPGKMTALVGHSGSGKSTILNLFLRFYDPEKGTVKMDGEDVKSYSLEELRKQISVVFQETYLFYGTIADNIRMARPDATDTEVEAAARAANAHEFISRFPQGYQTVTGERGMTLSGGERQRISIARAFLKNAPILFLDEATSSMDSQSEAIVQESIQRLIQGRTTVVIAHRLSTIRHADQILVIEDGAVAEQGIHEELIKKDGLYAAFVKAQEKMQHETE